MNDLEKIFEKVIPNTFGLTNCPWAGQDNCPGLNYFINAKQVPFHLDWYEVLKDLTRLSETPNSFGHWRRGEIQTATGLGRFNEFDWLREKTLAERDELYLKGYNYVGRHRTLGIMCWGHNVTLPDRKTFVPFLTAMTSVALMHSLNTGVGQVKDLMSCDPDQVVMYRLQETIQATIDEALAQRLLGLPSGATHRSVVYNKEERYLEVTIQFLEPLLHPVSGMLKVYPILHTGRTPVEVSGALATVPDLLNVLYLPGTMDFNNLHVVTKQ